MNHGALSEREEGLQAVHSKEEPDSTWRAEMLSAINGGEVAAGTDSLLSLTYHELDRVWLENTLLDLVDNGPDPQIRALAVVCLGHVARMHRAITKATVLPKLHELKSDPLLRARAINALEDIDIFVRE